MPSSDGNKPGLYYSYRSAHGAMLFSQSYACSYPNHMFINPQNQVMKTFKANNDKTSKGKNTLASESRTRPITALPVFPHNERQRICLNVAAARLSTSCSSLKASSAMTNSAAESKSSPPASWPLSTSLADFLTDFIFFWITVIKFTQTSNYTSFQNVNTYNQPTVTFSTNIY